MQVMQGAAKLLETLNKAGFEAYLIGGAVRDILMKTKPHDFDIVTNARPEEIIEVIRKAGFRSTDLVGKSFGVVVAALPEGNYEIATYRSERYGEDSHRPVEVAYADTLEEDVSRRDFTVNGLAMSLNGEIVDYVGGQKDLRRRLLRTIGNPHVRFAEDALRLFRACRFVGKLDFMPDQQLVMGMGAALHRVKGLSMERVRTELEALLLTKTVAKGLDLLVQSGLGECSCRQSKGGKVIDVPILPELSHLVGLPQEIEFHAFDAWYHTLAVVQAAKPELAIRWAALFHDVAKGLPDIRAVRHGRLTDYGHDDRGAEIAEAVLRRFQYPAKKAARVGWLVKNHMRFHYFAGVQEADPWKWMREEASSGNFRTNGELEEACRELMELGIADVIGCGRRHTVTDGTRAFGECLMHIAREMPIHTRDLHYDTRLVKLAGPQTGKLLTQLVLRVRNGQLENTPDALYEAAEHWLTRRAASSEAKTGEARVHEG